MRAVITVLSVTILLFMLFYVFGPDPAQIMAGPKAPAEVVENLREQFGLNRPLHIQLGTHLKDMLSFNLGKSLVSKEPVIDIFKQRAGPSLSLVLPAFVMSFLISLFFAFLSAYFVNRILDRTILMMCVITMSVSSLVFIIFGQFVLAYHFGWFEISGYEDGFIERWPYLALPILLYVVMSLGGDIRIYRSVILEQIKQDYMLVARSKGLTEWAVATKHLLKNMMIPVVTLVVIQIPFLVLGSLLLEKFFGIPGLGDLMLNAINSGDFPIVKAMVFFGAVFLEGGNILSDILYAYLDPRIQLSSLAKGQSA